VSQPRLDVPALLGPIVAVDERVHLGGVVASSIVVF